MTFYNNMFPIETGDFFEILAKIKQYILSYILRNQVCAFAIMLKNYIRAKGFSLM